MTDRGRLLWLAVGLMLGAAGIGSWVAWHPTARAGNDRYEDYILCTGAVAINPNAPTDGVWMLDYRAGKLLGTLIDRTQGKNGKLVTRLIHFVVPLAETGTPITTEADVPGPNGASPGYR